METRIALFQKKEIRKTTHENEWWFVIADVVAALTDSANPADYLKKIRKRDPSLAGAFKGEGQLVPPSPWSSLRQVVRKNCSTGTPRAEPHLRH